MTNTKTTRSQKKPKATRQYTEDDLLEAYARGSRDGAEEGYADGYAEGVKHGRSSSNVIASTPTVH